MGFFSTEFDYYYLVMVVVDISPKWFINDLYSCIIFFYERYYYSAYVTEIQFSSTQFSSIQHNYTHRIVTRTVMLLLVRLIVFCDNDRVHHVLKY